MTGTLAKTVVCMASADGSRGEAGRMPSARLVYNPAVPWEIDLELKNANRQVVVWRTSRDLLHLALLVDRSGSSAGAGDVRVSVDGDEVRLELSSPTGYVVLWLPYAAVREFLLVTLHEVPLDTEADHVDWDGVIEQLLQEEAQS